MEQQNLILNRYLDKMFHLRVTLPALTREDVNQLADMHLERNIIYSGKKYPFKHFISPLVGENNVESLQYALGDALMVRDLRNPRIITRIFNRLYLATTAGLTISQALLRFGKHLELSWAIEIFILWLGVVERWPQVRVAFQDAYGDNYALRLIQIAWRYLGAETDISTEPDWIHEYIPAAVKRLPRPEDVPELSQVMMKLCGLEKPDDLINHHYQTHYYYADMLHEYDLSLISVGL